jgi:nucleoside-diphosphate-sugar epimerase
VSDIVRGNLLAADAADMAGQAINVATGQQFALLDLIAAINKVLGTDIEPKFADPRPGDAPESLADISLARTLLGYEPQVGFDEGLARSIEYYRGLV